MDWWPFRSRRDSKIADGEIVAVTGVVRPLDTLLEAPLSGRQAVAYLSTAKLMGRSSSLSSHHELLYDVSHHDIVPFDLETQDRVIRIDVRQVELVVRPLPSDPRNYDREGAFAMKHASGNVSLRDSIFEERCVEPGARVEIRGMAIAELDPSRGEQGFRDTVVRFRIVSHDDISPISIRTAR